MTEETKKKISASLKGIVPWNKGVKATAEHRRKISEGLKGIVFTEERRRNISAALKGKSPSLEIRKKISATLTGRKNPEHAAFMTGRRLSREAKEKVRRFQIGRARSAQTRFKMGVSKRAEQNPRWIADRALLAPQHDRQLIAYTDWRTAVYQRDGFKCQMANDNCSGAIEAHHILAWALFPDLRFEVKNGITLCNFHHPKGRTAEKRLSPFLRKLVASKYN